MNYIKSNGHLLVKNWRQRDQNHELAKKRKFHVSNGILDLSTRKHHTECVFDRCRGLKFRSAWDRIDQRNHPANLHRPHYYALRNDVLRCYFARKSWDFDLFALPVVPFPRCSRPRPLLQILAASNCIILHDYARPRYHGCDFQAEFTLLSDRSSCLSNTYFSDNVGEHFTHDFWDKEPINASNSVTSTLSRHILLLEFGKWLLFYLSDTGDQGNWVWPAFIADKSQYANYLRQIRQ